MEFRLAHKGTVSECREKLNGALAELAPPRTEAHVVVRSICHYIVTENLDPLEARKGPGAETEFSIECVVNVAEVARSQ